MDRMPRIKFKDHLNRIFHLEMCYDNPLPYESADPNDPRKIRKSFRYTFKDLETGQQFTAYLSQNTDVVRNLLRYRRGDQFDIRMVSVKNAAGKSYFKYEVAPINTLRAVGDLNETPVFQPVEPVSPIGNIEEDLGF